MKDLRIQFKESDILTQNYSQAGQDLFVLSVLDGKREGKFLDLGCHHPTQGGNNTYLLENKFGWTGLSYDIDPIPIKEFPKYRKSIAHCQDCTKLDWNEVLSFSNHFDYLSLDLEPASITYQCLENIPLDKIEFSVITYEHDMYRFGEEYKIASHRLLSSYGYIRICENIKHNGNIFEDWYINPKYVKMTTQLENLKYHSNKEYSDIIFLNLDYNYTIVTGLIDDVNDYRSSDIYLDLSKELLNLDIPKIIFISEKHFDFIKKNSDCRVTQIIKFEKENMYQFYSQFSENQDYNLPININLKKDTLDYFKCINLKSLWLKKSKELSKFNLENYIWIDFGIKHMHKNIEISSLFKKEILFEKEKIRMPRHSIAKIENEENIIFSIDDIKWYALGSCLLINKNLIDIFHNLCQNELIDIIKSNKITWEVNIWAKLMKDFPKLFNIYYVEYHNENILKYMFENNDKNFNMLFSKSIDFFNKKNYIESNNILNKLHLYSKNNFDLERIEFLKNILNISVYKDKILYFLKDILYYINNFSFNIDFFIENLFNLSFVLENEKKSLKKNIDIIQLNNYKNSNPCIFYDNNKKITNIRYVNYKIIDDKHVYFNNSEYKHRTLNLNNENIIFEEYNEDLIFFKENKYLGIEDIRLFKKDNKIKFIATTTQFNKKGLNQICVGDYLVNGENKLIVENVYNSPSNINEKNWLVLDEDKFIYSYYPFTLYDFNLKKIYEYNKLPRIFQLFRGSANPININGLKYVLVHSTIETSKRHYIHWILILNNENTPIAYSLPFKFEGKTIEYCLSMNYLSNGNLEFAYSTYDNTSKTLEIPFSYFNDKFLFI